MNLISRAMFATPISFCFCFSRSIQSVLWKLGLLIFEQNKKIEWGFHHFYQHNCWSVCTSNLDAVKLYINLKMAVQLMLKFSFYRTRVRSLVMLVSDSLTDWLTNWLPFSKLDACEWCCVRCLQLAKAIKLSPAGFTTYLLSWQWKLLKQKLYVLIWY